MTNRPALTPRRLRFRKPLILLSSGLLLLVPFVRVAKVAGAPSQVPHITRMFLEVIDPSVFNTQLKITIEGEDADGDVNGLLLRYLDGRGSEITSGVSPLNPPGATTFTINFITSRTNFLGGCTVEVTLLDQSGNRSQPAQASYRSCTQPILGSATVAAVNADQIQVQILGGDPDANTHRMLLEILNGAGAVLRGPEAIDTSSETLGQIEFRALVTLSGISRLSDPRAVRLQLEDIQGNRSTPVEASFLPGEGLPDLAFTSFTVDPLTVKPGASVVVKFTVTNLGNETTNNASSAEVRLSRDAVIEGGDFLLDAFLIRALDSGQSTSGNRTVVIPGSALPGIYYIGMTLDDGNRISESDESNNSQSKILVVQAAEDHENPKVQVFSPRSGDVIAPASPLSVVFESLDDTGVVSQNVDLSTDGGETFTQVAEKLAADVRSFVFPIPPDYSLASPNCVVRVTARDSAGNVGMGLSGAFTIGETVPPTVRIISPGGGETLTAGNPSLIVFQGADNDAVAGFMIEASTDGGESFPLVISYSGGSAQQVIWNVPENLETFQGRIRVTARDRTGNTASVVSGVISIRKPPLTPPLLQVHLQFDFPPPGQIAPPQNVKVIASEVRTPIAGTTISVVDAAAYPSDPASLPEAGLTAPTFSPALIGYNIYRIVQPPPGQVSPGAAEIVGNPNNLVGSAPATSHTFADLVSGKKGDNFLYAIKSIFSNGAESQGSDPAGTDLPVIRNPTFRKRTIYIDSVGSRIAPSGALLIVNDRETYALQLDTQAGSFFVPQNEGSSPSGLPPKRLLQPGVAVRLAVRNPDGKQSVGVVFTRN